MSSGEEFELGKMQSFKKYHMRVVKEKHDVTIMEDLRACGMWKFIGKEWVSMPYLSLTRSSAMGMQMLLTMSSLLKNAMRKGILAFHSTHKLLTNSYPMHILGIIDADQSFHPI